MKTRAIAVRGAIFYPDEKCYAQINAAHCYFKAEQFKLFYALLAPYRQEMSRVTALISDNCPRDLIWESSIQKPQNGLQFFLYFPSMSRIACITCQRFLPVAIKKHLSFDDEQKVKFAFERFFNNGYAPTTDPDADCKMSLDYYNLEIINQVV